VNIKQMQNATIMTAFKNVARTIALGTRLRGSFVSSTIDQYVSAPVRTRTELLNLLMWRTPSKLLIGYAVASIPIENATPGLPHPASVCNVVKTYSGVLRFESVQSVVIMATKKTTWNIPPIVSR
jgi:hypothetical protein